jgi:hypothetical protein
VPLGKTLEIRRFGMCRGFQLPDFRRRPGKIPQPNLASQLWGGRRGGSQSPDDRVVFDRYDGLAIQPRRGFTGRRRIGFQKGPRCGFLVRRTVRAFEHGTMVICESTARREDTGREQSSG